MTTRIIKGDVREKMAELPADYFDAIITSPPYYGLRSYLPDNHPLKHFEIGLEPTLDAYLETIVAVCREMRRVLKPSGIMFLNIGDSYAGGVTGRNDMNESDLARRAAAYGTGRGPGSGPRDVNRKQRNIPFGLKPKDLCLVPERLGIALQEPFYTGLIRNESDRAWLAAMFDAEGCFGIRQQQRSGGVEGWNDTYIPYCAIKMSDRQCLDRAVAITGLGSVREEAWRLGTDARLINTTRVPLVWRLDGNKAVQIARELYPNLLIKALQAACIFTLDESNKTSRIGSGHCVPEDIIRQREELWRITKALNQRELMNIPDWIKAPPSLVEQGWFVRSKIIWHKLNPMPESCQDRPTSAHETIWMLTKSARYFWDAEAVREAINPNNKGECSVVERSGGTKFDDSGKPVGAIRKYETIKGANIRNVWSFASHPFPGAHFATFPPELAERCIKAGSSERGCCPACGKPWVRVKICTHEGRDWRSDRMIDAGIVGELSGDGGYKRGRSHEPLNDTKQYESVGWQPSCNCTPIVPQLAPSRILDPFAGAGTTGLVADRLGRDCTLIDLNTEYAEMALNRIKDDCPMFVEVAAE